MSRLRYAWNRARWAAKGCPRLSLDGNLEDFAANSTRHVLYWLRMLFWFVRAGEG